MNRISRRELLKSIGTCSGALAVGVVLSACGGSEAPASNQQSASPATEVRLEIGSKGDELYYDKDLLEVPANSKVTLTFKNNAQPNSGMLHNWVLVRPGTADAVANDGITAGEANGYLKPNDERVIAHTKMIGGGESDTITFDAPPPGTYDYLCTFPGHGVLMRGKFVVK